MKNEEKKEQELIKQIKLSGFNAGLTIVWSSYQCNSGLPTQQGAQVQRLPLEKSHVGKKCLDRTFLLCWEVSVIGRELPRENVA